MAAIQREGAEHLVGGMVDSLPPHLIGRGEAQEAVNIDPADLRGPTTRNGRSPYGSTNFASDQAIDGMRFWRREAGTLYTLARVGNTFYTWPSSGPIASVAKGGTIGSISRMSVLNNYLIVACDGMTPSKWDGTTWSVLGGGPPAEAKYIATWISKIWLAGNDANPQTVYFSATLNPDNWTAPFDAGSITAQDGYGEPINGLMANGRSLLVFYRNHVDVITGTTVADMRRDLLLNRGLCSPTGYVSNGEVGFFASDEAIYMVSGVRVSDLTTLKIRSSYLAIPDKSKITLGMLGDLLLVVDYGSEIAYACAYRHNRWSKWTGQEWMILDTTSDNKLYGGTQGASTTQIYQLNTGSTDAGSGIVARWRTADCDFGWSDTKKALRALRLRSIPGIGTVTVTYYVNGNPVGSANQISFASTGAHSWAGIIGQSSIRGTHLGFEFSWTKAGTLLAWAAYAEIDTERGHIPLEY